MYRRILVPLDGSRFGDQALPAAIDIAVRTGASLELVHVHHYVERDGKPSAMPQYQFQHVAEADTRHDRAVMELERRALAETAANIELRYPVEVRTRILTGRTAEAILGEAGDIVADLVVLSTHARSGLDRLRHGSVAHSLLAQLNVPTLCVHPVGEAADVVGRPMERVLIPLDGSPFSEQILEPMSGLLSAMKARPALVHVVAPRPFLGSGTDDTYRTIVNRAQALNYLHDVADRWRGRMPEPVLLAFEDAQPGSLVAGLLSVGEYDMVAMATHGRGGLSAMIMGSVANDVLAASHVPVMLYRPRSVPLPGLAAIDVSGDAPSAADTRG